MESPPYTHVKLDILEYGHVALVTYNRPQSGNSLHPQMLADLAAAWRWVDGQPSIRVVVQSGAGKFFNTGMELLDSNGMSFARGSDFHEINRILILSDKILIAAVNGPAAGYGVSSLALYDLVYSVPDAYFFTPFVKWGMAAEGGSSVSFPRLMGHQKAASLFLAADHIGALEAERLGLVSKILPKDGFLERVIQIAGTIAQSAPGSLRATKEQMRQPVRQDLLEANDRECDLLHRERYGSAEYQAAVERFRAAKREKQRLEDDKHKHKIKAKM
jgi:Delta3-Delta2-enoyl-CoA isomerase